MQFVVDYRLVRYPHIGYEVELNVKIMKVGVLTRMPITKFRIENQKVIRLCECSSVPPVMIIAGPNGVGKSTLLYCLERKTGGSVETTGRVYTFLLTGFARKQVILSQFCAK